MRDTYRGYVNQWECDENGHMNLQFYLAKAADASLALLTDIGLGLEENRRSNRAIVNRGHHMRFHREFRATDTLAVRSGITRLERTSITIYHEVRNPVADALAASIAIEVELLDREAGRPLDMPDRVVNDAHDWSAALPEHARPRSVTEAALDLHQRPTIERARKIGMWESARAAVQVRDCDDAGFVEPRYYLNRLSDAQAHNWAMLGLNRQLLAQNGWGSATVELRMKHVVPFVAGDSVVVMSGLREIGSKTVQLHHWFFNALTGEIASLAQAAALIFDMNSRNAIGVPDGYQDSVAAKLAAFR